MRPLSAHDIFQLWERGQNQYPVDRALTLLVNTCPEMTREDLTRLSVGQRDSLLLTLRERTFGPRLDCYVGCPQCHESLEFSLRVEDIRPTDDTETNEVEQTLMVDDVELRYRLPTSMDLAAVALRDDVAEARGILIRRCTLQARRGETQIDIEALPDTVISALGTHIAQQEGLDKMQVDLHCPTCGHGWPMIMDIVSFFWTEICAQAKRLLLEVHSLARAYGWREADILSMSARRRQLYLEMVA